MNNTNLYKPGVGIAPDVKEVKSISKEVHLSKCLHVFNTERQRDFLCHDLGTSPKVSLLWN